MSVSVVFQQNHGLIPLVAAASVFVHVWAAAKVGAARKRYGIEYPQMYAEQSDKNAKAFNCVQRSHQNMLENLPVFYVMLLMGAIYRPLPAAVIGAARVSVFIFYIKGYSSGDVSKRRIGALGHLMVLGLVGLTVEASFKMLGFL